MRRKLTAAALALALSAFGPMSSALAATYGPYTKGCGSQFVEVQSKAKYDVNHYYPSGTLRVLFTNVDYQIRKTHTGYNSTSWKVTANDSIVVAGTKANCVTIG